MANLWEWQERTRGKSLTDDDVWEWMSFDGDGNPTQPMDRTNPLHQLVMRRMKGALPKLDELANKMIFDVFSQPSTTGADGLADLIKAWGR